MQLSLDEIEALVAEWRRCDRRIAEIQGQLVAAIGGAAVASVAVGTSAPVTASPVPRPPPAPPTPPAVSNRTPSPVAARRSRSEYDMIARGRKSRTILETFALMGGRAHREEIAAEIPNPENNPHHADQVGSLLRNMKINGGFVDLIAPRGPWVITPKGWEAIGMEPPAPDPGPSPESPPLLSLPT